MFSSAAVEGRGEDVAQVLRQKSDYQQLADSLGHLQRAVSFYLLLCFLLLLLSANGNHSPETKPYQTVCHLTKTSLCYIWIYEK